MGQAMPDLENLPRTLQLLKKGEVLELEFVDQRQLPARLEVRATRDWRQVVAAVRNLSVRGAPAIGLAGASAVALWLSSRRKQQVDRGLIDEFKGVLETVSNARPTAVNLKWAVEKASRAVSPLLEEGASVEDAAAALYAAVKQMERDDERTNRAIGDNGAELIGRDSAVLTHCNAGSLATSFYGTALGVVYSASAQGKIRKVYADETRPVGQGARLTAWELSRARIPVVLICDNMAASLMAAGEVDVVVVGADRIAANGDTANKIGTYGLAVLAAAHGIPFYVAAPSSTFDLSIGCGGLIEIEQRCASEVTAEPIEGVEIFNPAFDITPARYITKFITEQGIFGPEEIGEAFVKSA